MFDSALIRPYRPSDRGAVRQLCCDTGSAGAPVDSWFPDRELFADVVAMPYTDYLPQWAHVAEAGGTVIGYVLGSIEPQAHARARWRAVAAGLWGAMRRGTLCSPPWWRLIWANRLYWRSPGWGEVPAESIYPAEVHVNLQAHTRSRGTGQRLVEAFVQQASEARAPGIKASVREDNSRARHFFERLGFEPLARRPLLRLPHGEAWFRIWYGRRLRS